MIQNAAVAAEVSLLAAGLPGAVDISVISTELGANSGNRLANMPKLSYYMSLENDLTFMGKPAFIIFDYSYIDRI